MVYQHIALKVAQAGAFAYGRTLNDEEMEALVVDLFSRKEPNFTPDGKRTYNVLTFNQIAKLFWEQYEESKYSDDIIGYVDECGNAIVRR